MPINQVILQPIPSNTSAVSSVAGKTGAVTLVEADIASLVSDLSAKATTAQLSNYLTIGGNGSSLTGITTSQISGLGTAATANSSAFDASGTAAAVQTNLTSHTSNTTNPHSTTAAQVGAYSTSTTDSLLAAKASLSGATFTGGVTMSGGASIAGVTFTAPSTFNFTTLAANNGSITLTGSGQSCTLDAAGFHIANTTATSMQNTTCTLDSGSILHFANSSNITGDNVTTNITGINQVGAKWITAGGSGVTTEHTFSNDVGGGNVIAVQNLSVNGYSAIRFLSHSGVEFGAIGHADTGTSGTVDKTVGCMFIEISKLPASGPCPCDPFVINQTGDYSGLYGNTVGVPTINTRMKLDRDGNWYWFGPGSSTLPSDDAATNQANSYFWIEADTGNTTHTGTITASGGIDLAGEALDVNGGTIIDSTGTILFGTAIHTVGIQITNGSGITFSTSTGSKIGLAANQKFGFHGVTPTVQATGGALTAGSSYTSTEQGMINTMWTMLRNKGLLS